MSMKTQTPTPTPAPTKERGGTLAVALTERGSDWEMSFSDTGPGINPQQTEKIFEPFQSNFEGGTGLGLAIVYQIVQAHEGKVWARSEVGKGTSFVLRLRRMENVIENVIENEKKNNQREIASRTSSKSESAGAALAASVPGALGATRG
jgi:K+-sensing histidine kinase KdpD